MYSAWLQQVPDSYPPFLVLCAILRGQELSTPTILPTCTFAYIRQVRGCPVALDPSIMLSKLWWLQQVPDSYPPFLVLSALLRGQELSTPTIHRHG